MMNIIIFIIIVCFLLFLLYYGELASRLLLPMSLLGGSESRKFIWPLQTNIYPPNTVKQMIDLVNKGIYKFDILGDEEMKRIRDGAKLNKWPLEQLIGIRRMLSTDRNISSRYKMSNKILDRLYAEWKNNTPFDVVCKKYCFPPLAIMRHRYLIYKLENDHSELESFEFYMRNPQQTPEKIRKEMIYALDHDSENPAFQANIQARAFEFEEALGKFIRSSIDAHFVIQEDIVKEQTRKYGRAIATPDILFDKPIIINVNGYEHTIHWIDAKNYMLFEVDFIMSSIRRQAEKYTKLFGPGAFAFHYGYDSSAPTIDNVIYLDASMIPDFPENNISTGGVESFSEANVRHILEALTQSKFPCRHPAWLSLELDGYNEQLRIAFEYQGPQHTKYMPSVTTFGRTGKKISDASYKDYFQRIVNDSIKKQKAKEHNIDLIIIDYRIPRGALYNYILSRLYDITVARTNVDPILIPFRQRPQNYLLEQLYEPYRNSIYEKELDLTME